MRNSPGRARWCPRVQVAVLAGAVLPALVPASLLAQRAAGNPLVGFVRDAETGGPVQGARLTLDPSGQTLVSDSAGAFAFPDPPEGWVTIRAEAVGYGSAALTLSLPRQGAPVVLTLSPQPLIIDGIEVPVDGPRVPDGAVVGIVRDASTGEPLLGADITVPERGRGVRATTQGAGTFLLQGLPPQRHLLLVRRLGYESAYIQVRPLDAGGAPLDVSLEPNTELMAGVARIQERLTTIRSSVTGAPVRVMRREQLAASPWPDVRTWLSARLGVRPMDCPQNSALPDCVPMPGGGVSGLLICLDGVPATGGLMQLDSYRVQDFELVEVIGGAYLRVFTTRFFEAHGYTPENTPRLCPWPS